MKAVPGIFPRSGPALEQGPPAAWGCIGLLGSKRYGSQQRDHSRWVRRQ